MNKREIAMMLIKQCNLEFSFEFQYKERWYEVLSCESGFCGNYPDDIKDLDLIILDCSNDNIRNINIE
jgi:hypothetical protein